jgi:hypothetical protein
VALISQGGAESGAGGSIDGFTFGGTVAVDAAAALSTGGRYGYRVTAGISYIEQAFTVTDDVWYYARAKFRVSSLPSAGQTNYLARFLSGSSEVVRFPLFDDGHIGVGGTGVTVDSGGSSATTAANTVHTLEVAARRNTGNSRLEFIAQLDGVEFTRGHLAITTFDRVRFGVQNTSTNGVTNTDFDDIIVLDGSGASNTTWPDYRTAVYLAVPASDSVIGANWTLGAGGAVSANAFDSVNNTPPSGKTSGSAADGDQIKNVVSNTGSAADAEFNCQTYEAAGAPAGYTISNVHPVASFGPGANSGVTSGLSSTANPSSAETTLGSPSSAVSTFGTGWTRHPGTLTPSPGVASSAAAKVKVGKRNLTTTALFYCFVGVHFQATPPGSQTVTPTGIASDEAFGAPAVVGDGLVRPAGIASGEAFGAPTVAGAGVIMPAGIASDEAFGAPTVILGVLIQPGGVPSEEAFGTPEINPPQFITDAGAIGSGEAAGLPTVVDSGPHVIAPAGIASDAAFGAPTVWRASEEGAPYVPPGPGVTGSPGNRPRDRFTNPRTGETYDFAINHFTEDVRRAAFDAELGAPNPDVGLVRQQGSEGIAPLSISGMIVDPAQNARFEAFFAECEDDELVFHDALGDEALVLIESYDSQLQRTPRNPHDPNLRLWWRYTLVMTIIEVRAGSFVGES